MAYGKVIEINETGALVLFENLDIQKTVKVCRHIGQELKPGDEVIVLFETDMINGAVVGVV